MARVYARLASAEAERRPSLELISKLVASAFRRTRAGRLKPAATVVKPALVFVHRDALEEDPDAA
jgi:hypothetical protein